MSGGRYCKNCGFRIEYTDVPTGRTFFGPFWRKAWVHVRSVGAGDTACIWHAEPKRKGDRTLYQQMADQRATISQLKDILRRVERASARGDLEDVQQQIAHFDSTYDAILNSFDGSPR